MEITWGIICTVNVGFCFNNFKAWENNLKFLKENITYG